MYATRRDLNQYRQAGPIAEAAVADPHRLVQMLFEGALERVAMARGAMQHGHVQIKGLKISQTIAIVEYLRGTLDLERGGDLAGNLDALYEYIARRLFAANLRNDSEALEEVARLLRELKAGWDAMPQTMRKTS